MLARRTVCLATFLTFGGCECIPDSGIKPDTTSTTSTTTTPPVEAGLEVVAGGPCPSSEARRAPTSQCPAGRQSVLRGPDGCTTVEGWAHTELGGYCLYVFTKAAPTGFVDNATFRTLQHLEPPAPLENALGVPTSPDCMMVASAPPSSQLASRETLARQFSEGLGVEGEVGDTRVYVAVIDTAPKVRDQARSLHGALMAMIIERTSGGPAIEVHTFPGLPRDRLGKPDLAKGGYYGYQSDLAFAIDEALTDWRGSGAAKLILNLSVGWEPFPSAQSPVLVEQLRRARCADALILAAVGNRHPRACPGEATGPAFLVSEPSPPGESCGDDLGPERVEPRGPLVIPVSAVDHQGRPLDLSRANAPLAALGVDAVVKIGDSYYGPMSGSSVATAVMSGIAARIWSSQPSLAAHDLMLQLYYENQSNDATVDASVAHEGWTDQHVVGLRPTTPKSDPVGPTSEQPSADLRQAQCEDECGLQETVWWASGLANLYANTLSAWVIPQPDDVVCPTCKIDKNKLVLAISKGYPTSAADVRVTFWSNPRVTETIHFGPLPLLPVEGSSGPTTTLTLTNTQLCTVDRDGSTPSAAYVEFVFSDATGTYAVGNSIGVSSGTPCP